MKNIEITIERTERDFYGIEFYLSENYKNLGEKEKLGKNPIRKPQFYLP